MVTYRATQKKDVEIEGKIEKWKERRHEYGRNIVELRADAEKAHGERKRIMSNSGGDALGLEKELDKIKELRELLELLGERAELYIRERIKDGAWKLFKAILSDTQFDSIELSDEYSFELIDKGGYSYKVNTLSVGESKTLALALITTLSNDIGYSDTPLFVDNLFAGLSTTCFEEVTRCVESISDKKQIFITYLESRDGAKVSNLFNPTIIRQSIHAAKNEEGKCYLEEDK